MLRILLVEDQRDIAANLWDFLERRGYTMDHAVDGVTGLRLALENTYDVIVLDLGLPRMDGLELCSALRAEHRQTPVLMLTARDTLEDKLRGFAGGADDYLVKPFAIRELEARIKALHRRGQPLSGDTLRVGDLVFDTEHVNIEREGRSLALTRAGTKLLELLMRRSPNLVRHAELAHVLWGDAGGDPASLHTHMSMLRAAIDRPFPAQLLHTVHGIGYRLVAEPDADSGSHAA